jgi:hypothetical protein
MRELFETELLKAIRLLRDGEERLARMEKLVSQPHANPAHREIAARALRAMEVSVGLARAHVQRLTAQN